MKGLRGPVSDERRAEAHIAADARRVEHEPSIRIGERVVVARAVVWIDDDDANHLSAVRAACEHAAQHLGRFANDCATLQQERVITTQRQ